MYRRSSAPTHDLVRPLLQSYLNLLLVFLPLALAAAILSWSPDIVLAFNFLAIIPLSGLVHLACEDLSANLSPTLGRLLVAVSDNLVELVVSITPRLLRLLDFSNLGKIGIVALCKGEIRIVQLSMIGSVLCYSLLVSAHIKILASVHAAEIARFWVPALLFTVYVLGRDVSITLPRTALLHSN